MKTILATTYAVNPYKGSEDGMGWNFVCQIARYNRVIAVTRRNNRPHIEKYMKANPSKLYKNIEFLYFDLPDWVMKLKQGPRFAMPYYYAWQYFVPNFLEKQNIEFDIAHNVNFHNDWTPSRLWKLGKPFVWGPTGHHPLIPEQFLRPIYGESAFKQDRKTWKLKNFFWNKDPNLSKTVQKADHIIAMNKSVQGVLNTNKKVQIMPSVASEDFGEFSNKDFDELNVISAGRLVPLKGFDVTIEAFSNFFHRLSEDQRSKVNLKIVGSGPEEQMLKSLCKSRGVEHHVEFISWIERSELQKIYAKSNLFLFPSHEGAGMVVSEALSYSLPVVCFDNCGPGEFVTEECGIAIPYGEYNSTIEAFGESIFDLYQDKEKFKAMSNAARQRFKDWLHWDVRGEQLNDIYNNL